MNDDYNLVFGFGRHGKEIRNFEEATIPER